jgi:glycosyltransferase involved in cell wall biosynthesis
MKKKVLIYVVAYNHEKFIEKTINRINKEVFLKYETEILISDDKSNDSTFEIISNIKKNFDQNCKISILSNPINQGYGGNQKIGYFYAVKNNFDYVVLLHGDGQYAPELIEKLLENIQDDNAGAIFGSRMIDKGSALKGGMPLYKFVGNKILTYVQNKILGSNLSEFHSGYRVYSTDVLKKIPFHLNSNDYSFDTEIIIQLLFSKQKISEMSIPTYYGEEISYVNGLYYAYQIIRETLKASIQKFNIFYEKKYDFSDDKNIYLPKENFKSPHSEAIKRVKENSFVLDIGCNDGKIGNLLIEKKNCKVIGADQNKKNLNYQITDFHSIDLDKELPDLEYDKLDYILLLDVIEHIKNPESFMKKLYDKISNNEKVEIIISTGNISFVVIRLMLLVGFFNYGKRGILDKTHTRLFTFASLKSLIKGSNFKIKDIAGIPCPFPIVLKSKLISNFLININSFFIMISKSIFSYQMLMQIKPNRSLNLILDKAQKKYGKNN